MYQVGNIKFENKLELQEFVLSIYRNNLHSDRLTDKDLRFVRDLIRLNLETRQISKFHTFAAIRVSKDSSLPAFQVEYYDNGDWFEMNVSLARSIDALRTDVDSYINPKSLPPVAKVPFGKYKGKSVDELLKDKVYCVNSCHVDPGFLHVDPALDICDKSKILMWV